MNLNLGNVIESTTAMGPGQRAAIWVRGCSIGCAGCATPRYWSLEPTGLVSVDDVIRRLASAQEQHGLEGVSFSGGEPFEQACAVTVIARAARGLGLSTLSWSGYTLEHLQGRRAPVDSAELLQELDVLIDGAYLQGQARDLLPLRGSRNQRIHFLTDRYRETDIGPRQVTIEDRGGNLVTHGVTNYPRTDAVLRLLGATRR